MSRNFIYKLGLFIGLFFIIFSCSTNKKSEIASSLPTNTTRTWIGPQYWANPMQDWQLNNGQIECITSGGFRNVFVLTHEIGEQNGDFSMSVTAKNLNPTNDTLSQGWIGFEIGIRGEFDDYRDNAVRGRGFPVGITANGRLFIGRMDSLQKQITNFVLDDITIKITANQKEDGDYSITVETNGHAALHNKLTRKNISANWIVGGIALVCSHGRLQEFNADINTNEYPDWGTAKGTQRGGNINFGFSNWKIAGDKISVHHNRVFGPILFAQYTLSKGTLKITAQMPPIGNKDGQTVDLQVKPENKWKTVLVTPIDSLSRTATFKIEDWDNSKDIPYRLAYKLYADNNKLREYYYEGLIRKEPFHKKEIVVAAFTGNNDLGFPNNDIVESVKYHNPDLIFFSGDQIYEGVGGYGAQRAPFDKACLDYLRKWYLYGWAYGDLMRDRPTISITDDHDVYHGNIWGAGGIATPEGLQGGNAQDEGGYKMPAEWVKMVEKTQTSHLPDPYDPTPVHQGIGVYYTDMNYGGISFAVLEDRKFKSAPKPLLPEANINNGWAQNRHWDAVVDGDVQGAKLLGDRQLEFIDNWASDWTGNIWMKVVLSQTIFANVATLPKQKSYHDAVVPSLKIFNVGEYPPDDVPVKDMDSNGWPQTGRNKALKAISKSFAFHIAGDQHLGSTIQYGIDEWGDAGYAFCVPSISNVWPRRWFPSNGGQNRIENSPKYTGDFKDGFGNLITVSAVSNPIFTGQKPAKLYDRATGYGIVRFNKQSRNITIECWPRQANPKTDKQYPGWPITINQQDNYLKNASLFLPEIVVTGVKNPVIQIIDKANNEIVFTLRIKGKAYQPKVLNEGYYSIKIYETGTEKEKVFDSILARKKENLESIEVVFE